MGDKVFKEALAFGKGALDFAGKAHGAGDPQKYAEAVEKLHQGPDESYAMMRRLIEENDSLSDEEKFEKYKQLAKEQEEAKKRCGEYLEKHREKEAKIAIDVLCGVFTCGLYFVPKIASNTWRAISGTRPRRKIEISDAELLDESETQPSEQETVLVDSGDDPIESEQTNE